MFSSFSFRHANGSWMNVSRLARRTDKLPFDTQPKRFFFWHISQSRKTASVGFTWLNNACSACIWALYGPHKSRTALVLSSRFRCENDIRPGSNWQDERAWCCVHIARVYTAYQASKQLWPETCGILFIKDDDANALALKARRLALLNVELWLTQIFFFLFWFV